MAKKTSVMPTESGVKRAVLKLDGKMFELVYDFNSLCDTEPLVGCNLLHGISAAFLNTMKALQLRGLFYALLQPKQPFIPATKDKPESGISIATAAHMIRVDTMADIAEAISTAFALSMSKAVA